MSLRDFLWEYPVNFKKLYVWLTPFSHMILFLTISVIFFSLLFSKAGADFLNMDSRDTFVEGVIGSTTSLNPIVITSNQVDRDVMQLIFTKLVELDSQGSPKPALAKSWSVSSDARTYVFTLKDNYYWSDGEKVSATDVVFTFEYAKELAKKYGIDTFGVAVNEITIEARSDYEVVFRLPEVNATFFEMVSVYVVPYHVLVNTNVDSYIYEQFEKFPVGSGPYFVSRNDGSGILLSKNPYYPSNISLSYFEFRFFDDMKSLEQSFRANQIDGVGGYSGSTLGFTKEYSNKFDSYTYDLPFRKKIVFFNTRTQLFANSSLRRGLGYLIDRSGLISTLNIDGRVSDNPLPRVSWAYLSNLDTVKYNPKNADVELKLAGYTKNAKSGFYTTTDGKILSIDITYLESELNTQIVQYLKDSLEKEGVLLNPVPKSFEQISREVLASREFELILYEMEISVDPDQYNLWHSLKSDFPNLNIAGYKFNRVDIYLERARQVTDKRVRLENYINFQKALLNDYPAIFLYEPAYTYVINSDIDGYTGLDVKFPHQRFDNVINWKFK